MKGEWCSSRYGGYTGYVEPCYCDECAICDGCVDWDKGFTCERRGCHQLVCRECIGCMYCGWCEECVESESLIDSVTHDAYCRGHWKPLGPLSRNIRWAGQWQPGSAFGWLPPPIPSIHYPSLPHPRYLTAEDEGKLTNLGGSLYEVVRKSQGNGFTHELVA